jgi:ribose-phosphate pyrophosphokinase
MQQRIKIFAGTSHPQLAQSICDAIDLPLSKSEVVKFANENLMVRILENVRGCDVFYVQSSAPPVNEALVETLIAIDALKGASATRVTAVLPYLPYSRSDKKDQPRISITARLVADLLQTAGADRVLTMDLHAAQIQGFFHVPVDQLTGAPVLCDYLKNLDLSTCVLVAGDVGEAKDIGKFANALNLPVAIVDKRRYGNDDRAVATNLIGEVAGKHAIIVDDEIATGGTVIEATNFLMSRGALSVKVAATHAVLSGPAVERINNSVLDRVIVTDTIPLRDKKSSRIEVLSVAPLFAKAIRRIHDGDSISDLF